MAHGEGGTTKIGKKVIISMSLKGNRMRIKMQV